MQPIEVRLTKKGTSWDRFHAWNIQASPITQDHKAIQCFFKSTRMIHYRGSPPLSAQEAREVAAALMHLADQIDPPTQVRIPTNDD